MFRKRHHNTKQVQIRHSSTIKDQKEGSKDELIESGRDGKEEDMEEREEGEEDDHSLLMEAVELKQLRTLERRLGLRRDGKRVRRVVKRGKDHDDGGGEGHSDEDEDGEEVDGEDDDVVIEEGGHEGTDAHEKYELGSTFTMERQKSELEKKRQEYIDKSLVELGLKSSDTIHMMKSPTAEEENESWGKEEGEEDGRGERRENDRLGGRSADLYRIPVHLRVSRSRQDEDEKRIDSRKGGKRGEEHHGLGDGIDDGMDDDDVFGEGKLQGMTGLVQVELPLSERVKMMERTDKAKRKLERVHERRYERRSDEKDATNEKDGKGWKRDGGIGVDLDGIATSVDAVKHFVQNRGRCMHACMCPSIVSFQCMILTLTI
jgi:hypothetical protein